jgi:hypothetical protein
MIRHVIDAVAKRHVVIDNDPIAKTANEIGTNAGIQGRRQRLYQQCKKLLCQYTSIELSVKH